MVESCLDREHVLIRCVSHIHNALENVIDWFVFGVLYLCDLIYTCMLDVTLFKIA